MNPFAEYDYLPDHVPLWSTLTATVTKDLQITRRYIANLIGTFIQLAIRILFFFLLSTAVSIDGEAVIGRPIRGQDLFIFFQGAVLLFVFTRTSLWTPLNAVNRDLYNGTLEFLYSNPISRYAYYAGTVAAEAVIGLVVFLPVYLTLIFVSHASWVNMFLVLAVCLTALVSLAAMGIMISLLGLLWRRVNSIAEVLGIAFEVLAGAYFPITIFPKGIQYLAYLLPYTWGYDLVRYYSFDGNWRTILPVAYEWVIMIGFAVVFSIFSYRLSNQVERLAKENGLHLI